MLFDCVICVLLVRHTLYQIRAWVNCHRCKRSHVNITAFCACVADWLSVCWINSVFTLISYAFRNESKLRCTWHPPLHITHILSPNVFVEECNDVASETCATTRPIQLYISFLFRLRDLQLISLSRRATDAVRSKGKIRLSLISL